MVAEPLDKGPSSQGNDGGSVATVENLADLLRAVVRAGMGDTAKPAPPELLALVCVARRVREAGYPDTDDGRKLGLRDVLVDALASMGDGTYPGAGRLLLGLDVATRGRTLAERRRIAADSLDLTAATFRRNYEAGLVNALATELFRVETTPPETPAPETAAPVPVALEGPEPDGGPWAGVGSLAGWRRPALGLLRPRRTRVATAGADRVLLVVVVAVVLWRRSGLDTALLWVVLPALAVHGLRLLVEMSSGLVAWVDALPRCCLVVVLVYLAVVRLMSSSADVPSCDVLTGETLEENADGDYHCVAAAPVEDDSSGVDVEDLPTYTEPTYAEVPTEPATAVCPPDEPDERRLVFDGPPPWCLGDPNQELIATVMTNRGAFEIHLDPGLAPWGVNAFVFLARWGFYDGITIAGTRSAESDDTQSGALFNDWLYFSSPYEEDPPWPLAGFLMDAEPFEDDYDTDSRTAPIYVVLPATVDPDTGEPNGYVDPTRPTFAFSSFALAELTQHPDSLIGEAVELAQSDRQETCPVEGERYSCNPRVISLAPAGDRYGRPTHEVPIVVDSITVETPDEAEHRQEHDEVLADLAEVEDDITDLEDDFAEQQNPPWPDEPVERDVLDWDRLEELREDRDDLLDELGDNPP